MRITDNQLGGIYFHNGRNFKTRKEAREALIDYHKIDNDYNELKKMSLDDLCVNFEWSIEPTKPIKKRG